MAKNSGDFKQLSKNAGDFLAILTPLIGDLKKNLLVTLGKAKMFDFELKGLELYLN